MSPRGIEREIDLQVRDMIFKSGIPLTLVAEAAGLRTADVLDWWSKRGFELNYDNVMSLCHFLGISIEHVEKGDYPADLIRKRIYDGPTVLPETYSLHASSFVRSSAHIIEYLSMMYGRRFVDRLLLKMNVHPLLFDNLDNRINLLFFIDFLNELSHHGLSLEEISSLARYLFLRVQDTEIGEKFAQAETYRDSYSVLAELTPRFENNFDYDFQIDAKKVRILAKPTEAEYFLHNKSTAALERLFAYRRTAFGWFPILSSLAPLELKIRSCVLRGDSETIYEIDLPNGVKQKSNLIGSYLTLLGGA
jgi:hypothetical protein